MSDTQLTAGLIAPAQAYQNPLMVMPTSAAAQTPQQAADPMDLTNKYNTKLSHDDEAKYQQWVVQQSAKQGRDMSRDSYDYDMRGAWKSGAAAADNGHFPDTFKKPNHPTFSTQSQYHGVDGNHGGSWGGGQNGAPWTFTPGASNMWAPADLKAYFRKVEPGNVLVLPN